jgi:dienelactone hydrolase
VSARIAAERLRSHNSAGYSLAKSDPLCQDPRSSDMQTLRAPFGPILPHTLIFALVLLSSSVKMIAQPDSPDWQRWLHAAGPVPEFAAPDSRAAWQSRRQEIRSRLWQLLGNLPPRPSTPRVETLSRKDRGDYIVEKFQFDNGAGAVVPGYLLLPKGTPGKAPAILYCHWHGGEYDNGKEELFRHEHTPVDPGPTWARHGYAVLGVDAYCFGERNGKGPGGPSEKGGAGEMTASKFNLWVGRSLWGMILRDDLMALDYLVSRPEIDAQRVAVTGISMGATRSWWLMALDDRIRAGVAVACLTRYQNLIAHEGLKYHGIYYFVPGLLNYFDTEAVVALAAPRPLLFQTGDQDAGSPVDGIQVIEQKVRPVYELLGAPSDFQSIIYPGVGHVYLPAMWEKTVSWIDTKLR